MVKNRPHVGQAGSPFPPTTPLPLSPVPISKTWIPWSPLSLGFFGISGRHRFRARLMALDPPPMEKWSARISDRQNHDDRVLARFKWRKSTPPPLPERANIPYDIFYQHPRLRICSCIRDAATCATATTRTAASSRGGPPPGAGASAPLPEPTHRNLVGATLSRTPRP